jgi:Big-like domain-containing protein/cadherin-like protein/exosortase sorting signal-containing protein
MNLRKFAGAKTAFAFLLLTLGYGSAASAATSTFHILLNLDNHINTGCDVPTLTGTFPGVERILITTVTTGGSSANVTSLAYQSCINPATDTFGPPTPLTPPPPDLPVGETNGTAGTSVIETYIPLSVAPVGNPPVIRLGVLAFDEGGVLRDELVQAQPTPGNGPPIILQLITPEGIPTLSEWGLILLALLLTSAALVTLRRRSAAALVMVLALLGVFGLAWAATSDLDGHTLGEWAGAQLATDPGDAPAGTDIRAFFGTSDVIRIYFRIDAALLFDTDDPPTAVADAATVTEDAPATAVDVLTNDTDTDAGPKSIASVTQPTNGTVVITGGGTGLTYQPNANYCNTPIPPGTADTFTYTLAQGGPTPTATVSMTVTCTDDPPTAVADAATVAEDAPATAVDVLTNDTDIDAGPKSIASVTQPANGTVVITGGGTGLTYQPNANYCNTPIPPGTADTFTYTLSPAGPTPTATVSMTVTCGDDPPTAVADTATVAEDAPATAVDVLTNDPDPDGGPKSIASVTQPTNGTVVITGGGTGLTYQPNANYCNTPIPPGTADTFTYTLSPAGPTPTATVSMTVTCDDDPPTAVADAATVAEDAPATAVDVLTNDTDTDAGPKSIASVTQPTNGTVVITGGGTGLTYQPNANYCNTPIPPGTADTFTYTLSPAGPTPTATVSMTVTCDDDPPTAVADAATVSEDAPATAVDVLTNDTDPDAGPKSIASVTQPTNGTVVITGGGTGLTYQPNANYCNTPIPPGTADTFTYTLSPAGPTPTATVSMTVTCDDDPPTAVNDAATVSEDAPATAVDVLTNDTDIDAGPKSIASVTQPTNGAVVITGGGTGLTYQPNADYCNTPIPPGTADTFTYTLSPAGPTPTATVSMTVTCINDAPVLDLDADDSGGTLGSNYAITFNEGQAAQFIEDTADATITDIDNTTLSSLTVTLTNLLDSGFEVLDVDLTGFPLFSKTYDTTTDPSKGVLTISATPAQSIADFVTLLRKVTYVNTDDDPDTTARTIEFVANDGTSNSNTATTTVTMGATDDAPTAVNDAATVNEDAPATAVDVLTNDTDPDGGPKTIASVTQPTNGSVVITGGGTGLTYQPNANYCNTPIPPGTADTFTYTLAQGGATPTATVSMTVTCSDDPPTAVNDAATVNEDAPATAVDVLTNDTDSDGGPKSIASVTQPANGSVVITGGGTGLTYQPNANYCNTPIPPGTADTFTYTLAQGGPTPTATVSMTVTCVDDPPTAVNDAATVNEDAPATAVDVLTNDTDIDAGPKSIASVTQPTNGAVVITGGGTGLTYQPNANYCNTPIPPGTADTFTYTLSPAGPTPTATVSMTVTCVDDPPTAVNDVATVTEDAPATAVDVLTNDTDIDAGPKSIASVTQPANGSVVITGGGTGLTYQPNANYCNTPIPPGSADTFTYTLAQGGPTPTATVSMTVTCVDDPPTAVNDAATVNEDAPATAVDVLTNDTDPDGGPKSITSVTQPTNGVVVITGGGTGLTYQPNLNYCNTPIPPGTADTFTYTLTPAGPTPTATVSMTVTCINDAPMPTTNPVSYSTAGNTQLHVEGKVLAGVVNTSDASGVDAKAGPFTDPDGPVAPAIVNNDAGVSANGGSFDIDPNGSFTYVPPANFNGTDSFTYQVTDTVTPTTGTVNIVVSEMIWYVHDVTGANNPAASDTGLSNNAFEVLQDAINAAGQDDYVFVFRGNTGATPHAPSGVMITNKDGLKLHGEGVGLSVPGFSNLVPAGLRPRANNSSGAVGGAEDNTFNVVINSGTIDNFEIRGFELAATDNAIDVTVSGLLGIAGIEIADNLVTGSGLEGVDFNHTSLSATASTLSFHDNTLTANGAAASIERAALAGALRVGAFHDNVVTGDSTGGLQVLGTGGVVTFDAAAAAGIQPVPGGTTVIGGPGNGIGGAGLVLSNVTGALNYANAASGNIGAGDLDIFTDSATALSAAGGVGGFDLDITANMGVLVANSGPAAVLSALDANIQLNSLTSSTSSSGVSLTNVSGTFSAPSGSSITKSSGGGTAFSVDNSAAGTTVLTSTYGGTINNSSSTGRSVSINNADSGSAISFTGQVTDSPGQGVSLTTNTGATISFSGGLTLSTGANTGFSAGGGGTVTVTDPAGATDNNITTTSGTALNLTNTTIGASGLTFESISAGTSGTPANGIVLNTTGSSGGLVVTGDGGGSNNGSGGTIQNTTAEGVLLNSTANVSLGYMNITNSGTDSIRITNINGFTLNRSNIDDAAGAAPADKAIDVGDFSTGTAVNGTINITNNVIGPAAGNSPHDSLAVGIGSGTSTWNVTNTTFRRTGNSGINIELRGAAVVNAFNVNTCTFAGAGFATSARGVFANNLDDSVMTLLTVQNSSFTNNNIHIDINQQNDTDPVGSSEFAILNNTTMTGARSHAINVFAAAGSFGGVFEGTISGNTIGNAGVADSGSAIGNGIRLNINGGADSTMLLNGNVIRQTPNGRGIEIIARNGTGGLDVTVTNNDVNPQALANPLAAILVQSNCLTICNTVRSDVRGNTVPSATDVTDLLTTYIELVESSSSTLELVDTTSPISGTCASELAATNTGSTGVLGACSLIAGPINTP